MKQHIRNKVNEIIKNNIAGAYTLYYSSLLDQLYVLYIVIIGIAFMMLAHLSIWPVLVLVVYIIIGYLFGAYRNHSFVLDATNLWIINARKPFVSIDAIELASIQKIIIGSNANAVLDRIFIIPSNVYVQIICKNINAQKMYYTNIDFAIDAKENEKSIEDLIDAIANKGIAIECVANRDEDDY